jgi:hypothetical protein
MEASIIAAVISASVVIASWFFNQAVATNVTRRRRIEKRYIKLIDNLQGFYSSSADVARKEQFVALYRECWLYSSDSVIKALNQFMESIKGDSAHTEEVKESNLGNCVLEMRKDLNRRQYLRKKRTRLTAEEFLHIQVQ